MKKLLKERFQQLAGIKPLYEQPTPNEIHVWSFATCIDQSINASGYEGSCPNVNPNNGYWYRAIATPGCNFPSQGGCPEGVQSPAFVEGNHKMWLMLGSPSVGTFTQMNYSDYYDAAYCMEYVGKMNVNNFSTYGLQSETFTAESFIQNTKSRCCKDLCIPDEPLDADGDGAIDPDKIITPKAKKKPIEKEPIKKRR